MKYTKICKFCGNSFETNRSYKEYCDAICRQKHINSNMRSSYSFLREPPPKKGKKKDTKVVECKGCYYYRPLASTVQNYACNYSLDTGEIRGIPPRDCYKKPNTPYSPIREREEE